VQSCNAAATCTARHQNNDRNHTTQRYHRYSGRSHTTQRCHRLVHNTAARHDAPLDIYGNTQRCHRSAWESREDGNLRNRATQCIAMQAPSTYNYMQRCRPHLHVHVGMQCLRCMQHAILMQPFHSRACVGRALARPWRPACRGTAKTTSHGAPSYSRNIGTT
jgi:hypothetical protein